MIIVSPRSLARARRSSARWSGSLRPACRQPSVRLRGWPRGHPVPAAHHCCAAPHLLHADAARPVVAQLPNPHWKPVTGCFAREIHLHLCERTRRRGAGADVPVAMRMGCQGGCALCFGRICCCAPSRPLLRPVGLVLPRASQRSGAVVFIWRARFSSKRFGLSAVGTWRGEPVGRRWRGVGVVAADRPSDQAGGAAQPLSTCGLGPRVITRAGTSVGSALSIWRPVSRAAPVVRGVSSPSRRAGEGPYQPT